MGLFSVFKKKENKFEKLSAEIRNKVFPGGAEEITNGVNDLMGIVDSGSREAITGLFLYESTLFLVSEDKSKARIVEGAMRRPGSVTSRRTAEQVYDYVLRRFAIKNFGTDDEILIKTLSASYGNVESNCTGDFINGAYGPYGRCWTNPIPVRGIPAENMYMKHLRTLYGGNIEWTRLGSGGADNIEHPIDFYAVKDIHGNELGNVFLSPYQDRTSRTAPEGFAYAE